jgi:hypothetical protein
MKCYILQAGLGTACIAVVVLSVFALIWGQVKLMMWFESQRFHWPKVLREGLSDRPGRILELIGSVVGGFALVLLVSMLVWTMGGELLKRWSHYCTG